MSKRSFNEIEQAIKNAAEGHEPAFDEQAWEKMEAMLDKEKDRKRPFVFWLWFLVPVLVGAGLISYFFFNDADSKIQHEVIAALKEDKPSAENNINTSTNTPEQNNNTILNSDNNNSTDLLQNGQKENEPKESFSKSTDIKKNNPVTSTLNNQTDSDKINYKRKRGDKTKGKMTVQIKFVNPEMGNENDEVTVQSTPPEESKSKLKDTKEEIVVIKVDADKTSEKEIEKIVDSVAKKLISDEKSKKKIARFYIVATGGAEANGVKLFSADKITGRYGLGLGYQLNKKLSVQTGFYVSNKKYGAQGSDYKIKAGSYWSTVDIKSIEANCKVYEIPLSVIYNFTPEKKLGIFASAGLSSYIMKREDYRFYYEHYGMTQQADAYYKENKNLFSVLRLSVGAEKKISGNFSVIASPGIAIPLSGVGEGEVKLFSTDISIGIKFTPFQKK